MAPTPTSKFNACRAKREMEELMADMVPMNREYDSKSCAELTKRISDEIKSRMKLLGYRRYKLAVEVCNMF